MTDALHIETVALSTLRPYPHNPRNGDTDAIVESIRVNGLYKPLVVAHDGVILAGNHTYAALLELGRTEAPIVRLSITSDDPAAARIVLADNRTSDRAQYDEAELLSLLRDLEAVDGLYGTAFSSDDLDDLIAKMQETLTEPLDLTGVTDSNPNLADKLERYEAMGRRMIVLDYPQEVYGEVTARLATMRVRHGVDSNADCLLAMLRAADHEA